MSTLLTQGAGVGALPAGLLIGQPGAILNPAAAMHQPASPNFPTIGHRSHKTPPPAATGDEHRTDSGLFLPERRLILPDGHTLMHPGFVVQGGDSFTLLPKGLPTTESGTIVVPGEAAILPKPGERLVTAAAIESPPVFASHAPTADDVIHTVFMSARFGEKSSSGGGKPPGARARGKSSGGGSESHRSSYTDG